MVTSIGVSVTVSGGECLLVSKDGGVGYMRVSSETAETISSRYYSCSGGNIFFGSRTCPQPDHIQASFITNQLL